MDDQKTPPERITVNITKKASEALARTTKQEDITKTDVVCKAINSYALLMELQNQNCVISITYPDGTKERLRFL